MAVHVLTRQVSGVTGPGAVFMGDKVGGMRKAGVSNCSSNKVPFVLQEVEVQTVE